MTLGNIAKRYAKALYLYATECKAEERVYEQAYALCHTMAHVPDLSRALLNPVVELPAKLSLLHNSVGGTMDDALVERYGNPFPVESALFEFENGMKGEATRTLFETAHGYQEGMFVYGSEKSFIWSFTDGDYPYIMTLGKENERRGKPTYIENVRMPDFNHLLPPELRDFTKAGGYDELNPQECLKKGAVGGHHGSHPHLVHEFVMSIVEERKPWIDEVMGANITAAGICAHISAMNNGESVTVPEF
jgi:hypothetical protein